MLVICIINWTRRVEENVKNANYGKTIFSSVCGLKFVNVKCNL